MSPRNLLVALAGQPNCGKSTVFNMLTGARQHVANYPGVTVEKKTGFFDLDDTHVELVDLPGTYSLTSYSLEERVARDFLLGDLPSVVIDVADGANLKRNLYLTLQLLEMEVPTVLNLNMMDVVERRGQRVDVAKLQEILGTPVVPTKAKKGEGKEALKAAVKSLVGKAHGPVYKIDYGQLEDHISELEAVLVEDPVLSVQYPVRWFAIKLLEGDAGVTELLTGTHLDAQKVFDRVESCRQRFHKEEGHACERHIAFTRHGSCAKIIRETVTFPEEKRRNLSDRADRYVCNRLLGPLILIAILFVLYEISIVFGNWLALQIWPLWGALESFAGDVLPQAGFLNDPILRSLGLWVVKSITAILNYLPIFFLLFSLIAVLEDSGYMPRMAFILDRLFRRFGLHGQSTLPMILGGVYVGGCAIPGVMATKAIPDERARLATIMIVPMMNCLAKVPLYLILIGAYFSDVAGSTMFFIATVTLFMALPVAKILSITVLKKRPSAPFIMEMPPYHVPTISGVLRRAIERVWLFMKKIVTVVAAVAVVVFVLINYPGLTDSRKAHYEDMQDAAVAAFMADVGRTGFKDEIGSEDVLPIILFGEAIRDAKRAVTDQDRAALIDAEFQEENPAYYAVARRVGKDGKALNKSLKKVIRVRKQIRREARAERFETSFLGTMGRALEPVTQWAGFNWRINIALLSAFAAKENSAATLGSIYGIDGSDQSVQESMKAGEGGFTPLHALALMLFMALYPPCVPASIMVRSQSNSTKWMLFSIGYQTLLGLFVASLVFTGGTVLGLTGVQAMWGFYALCVATTLIMAMIPTPEEKEAVVASNITQVNTIALKEE
ncbi:MULTISPECIES: ferrous iron transport protein B [unclassified Pseudodesulfovibrio]|uniref:ferrous iron transport protein B n=1 Tax=unclassified Pseudodesulfovibrio TaxID=2661612 RepID=UPI000FEB847C|nr:MULTISPECIES: ferrous iron transport protein B [unclassified Pseudodesulfovibrio]MCJ2163365.1 ferrous iron transport protein B [Pseudodesulfovibrio sp. S3-i]RWU06604.1 ferrous iron transport protein B [Pseudodesulfovibrio sp. S3]